MLPWRPAYVKGVGGVTSGVSQDWKQEQDPDAGLFRAAYGQPDDPLAH